MIQRCLASLAFADEIIVVDSGSTDQTVELAKQAGAKVTYHKWPGWAKQKNLAIDLATHDWIISLDADEWLPENAEKTIKTAIQSTQVDAYTLGRRTLFLGRWMAHGGWYPDRQIRLFRKSITRFADVPVHEKVIEPERQADLKIDIWHESYTSLKEYFAKNEKYSSAQALQQKNQSWLWPKLILKPIYRFGQTYFWQAGFLDGRHGILLAVLRSWYEWKVIWKILFPLTKPAQ